MKINYFLAVLFILKVQSSFAANAPQVQPVGLLWLRLELSKKMQNYFRVSNPGLYKKLDAATDEQIRALDVQLSDRQSDKKEVAQFFDATLKEDDCRTETKYNKQMYVAGALAGALLVTNLGLLIAARNVQCP